MRDRDFLAQLYRHHPQSPGNPDCRAREDEGRRLTRRAYSGILSLARTDGQSSSRKEPDMSQKTIDAASNATEKVEAYRDELVDLSARLMQAARANHGQAQQERPNWGHVGQMADARTLALQALATLGATTDEENEAAGF